MKLKKKESKFRDERPNPRKSDKGESVELPGRQNAGEPHDSKAFNKGITFKSANSLDELKANRKKIDK